MPDLYQKKIVDASVSTGTKTHADVRNLTSLSVFVSVTGGTSCAYQLEGTADPAGASGFVALAMRPSGGGAYATTAITVNAGAFSSVYLDPADNIQYVRVNQTARTGAATFDAWLNGEQ